MVHRIRALGEVLLGLVIGTQTIRSWPDLVSNPDWSVGEYAFVLSFPIAGAVILGFGIWDLYRSFRT